nr:MULTISPECIES: D-alanyl-D-alanine carboxypeptidase [unclassified Cryobacterium]
MVSAVDPALGSFAGAVVNAATGELLFDRSASDAAPGASAVKALTAAAALSVLGADYQLSTRVYQGTEPGSIVLVGGGDPTLSAATDSYYPNAPKLADLAEQVNAQWKLLNPPVVVVPDPPREENEDEEGDETEPDPAPTQRPTTTQQQITKVIVDVGLWSSADRWNQGWARGEQTTGTMAEVVPLMVDGDRADPKKAVSPRSTDPTGRAVTAFIRALGLDPAKVQVSNGSALTSRPLLGEVKSQPVKQLVGHMLRTGDNTLAEQLARVVSVEVDRGGAAASLTDVIGGALAQHGIDVSGLALSDASGVSAANAVPPQAIAGLMAKVASGDQTLAIMNDSLPVAGNKGGLEGRFGGDNAVVHGNVRAMPGAIDGAQTLAGLIIAADGTALGFSFHAVGAGGEATDAALDTLTAAVFNCGNNLSNV